LIITIHQYALHVLHFLFTGRAGRYGSEYDKGYVTTLNQEDIPHLHKMLAEEIENITQVAVTYPLGHPGGPVRAYHTLPLYTLPEANPLMV
jgi:hypothetical protein